MFVPRYTAMNMWVPSGVYMIMGLPYLVPDFQCSSLPRTHVYSTPIPTGLECTRKNRWTLSLPLVSSNVSGFVPLSILTSAVHSAKFTGKNEVVCE